MSAPRKFTDPVIDPSKKANAILDYVLNEEETQNNVIEEEKQQARVSEELSKEPIISVVSQRVQSRVLFITQDVSVFTEDSLQQRHFKTIATLFDEVHIIVVCEYWQAKRDVVRLQKNIWLYTTAARYWWTQPFIARSIAHYQLSFVDGFRPDIVVALDPFESGICGISIASHYNRVFQVHVLEDFLTDAFKTASTENKRRIKMAKYVLKRAQSVRVLTQVLKEKIAHLYPKTHDLMLLPQHYNIEAILASANIPNKEAEKLFPEYAFLALYVGPLDHDSTLFRVLDACRSILVSPKIGLLVLGDGPCKKEFMERAVILGIEKQVIFQSDMTKLISYFHRADILICPDTTADSEELIIKAAASGLPLLLSKTQLRSDLFTHEESAFLCDKEDTIDFSLQLKKFLNGSALRVQLRDNAKNVVKTRLHEDPEAFAIAYKDTVESVFSL